MERMGMPIIEQADKKEAEQKNPFEILTSELAGKTREELTPEQRETEDAFREKAFRDLMQLINDDKVLSHDCSNLESVLRRGILSPHRVLMAGFGTHDPQLQEHAERWSGKIVRDFYKDYQRFKQGELSSDEFEKKRQESIDQFPMTGRDRAKLYFEKIIPNRIDKNPDVKHTFEVARRLKDGSVPLPIVKAALRYQKRVTGENMLSSVNTHRMKTTFFWEHAPGMSFSGWSNKGRFVIFFDRPKSENLMDLGAIYIHNRDNDKRPLKQIDEMESFDIGVADKVFVRNFQAISFGLYDEINRTLYTKKDILNNKDILEKINFLQIKGVKLFDRNLISIPPLSGIKIVDDNDSLKSNQIQDNSSKLKDLDSENEIKSEEKIKNLIQENHWDWYEKYGEKE